ncbi:hypothetical protein Tco_0763035 [Tanacetum coccineum]
MLKVSPRKGVSPVAYTLELPEELSNIHSTFYVSNLKKCLSDESLVIPMKELQLDDKLNFVEKPIEFMDQEVKQLRQSHIPIVKEIGKSSRIDDKVVQDQTQRDDYDLQDERQDQPKEEEVEPRRSKRARTEKSFGPDLFLLWFQSLLSQLEIHGAGVSTEDAIRVLWSLPSFWVPSLLSLMVKGSTGSSSIARISKAFKKQTERGTETLDIEQKTMGGDLENRRTKALHFSSDTDVKTCDDYEGALVFDDDYEEALEFNDDQFEKESMLVYDTDIEDVIEEEEGFVGKG